MMRLCPVFDKQARATGAGELPKRMAVRTTPGVVRMMGATLGRTQRWRIARGS
jgi:hypothetical protein